MWIHKTGRVPGMHLLGCLMILRIQVGKLPFGTQCMFVLLPCFIILEILVSLSAHSIIPDTTAWWAWGASCTCLLCLLLIFQSSQGYDVMMEISKNNHTVHMILENFTYIPCMPSKNKKIHPVEQKRVWNWFSIFLLQRALFRAARFTCQPSHSNIDKRMFTSRPDHINPRAKCWI
jgi:hypothetical protein